MTVLLATASNLVVELLNQSDPASAFGVLTAERFKAAEISAAVLAADLSNSARLCASKSGRRQAFFITVAGVAFGAQLPTLTSVEAIQAQITGGPMAGLRSISPWGENMLAEIARENLNPLSLTRILPHAVLDNGTLYHNAAALILAGASSVSVNVIGVGQLVLTAACQAPDEFMYADVLGAVANLLMKDGERESAGNVFANLHEKEMDSLLAGGAGSWGQ
jgi:hypothetical protein